MIKILWMNTSSRLKSLAFYETLKHGSVYFSSYIFIQLISVISLPIFTKLLQPTDFGIYEVFNNTVRLLSIIFSLNLSAGFYRFYFDESYDKKSLVAYCVKNMLLYSTIGLIVFALFSTSILDFINLPKHLFPFIIIGIYVNIIMLFFNNYTNVQLKSKTYSIWNIVFNIFRVAFSIVCILWIAKNYYGRILGETIGMALITILILFIYFRKYFFIKGSINSKKELYVYSLGLIPIALSGFILGYFDTIIINAMENSNDAGLYSYAYKIAIIYSGFTAAFISANRPNMFELFNKKDEDAVKNQIKSLIKLITAVACFFIFFSETGGQILALNDKFYAALHLLPVLIIAYIFNDINTILGFYIYYEKKVQYLYWSIGVAALINIILNIIFIPKYGYQVAAYTTLVSYICMASFTYLIIKFVIKQNLPRWTIGIEGALIIATVTILNYFINNIELNIILNVFLKIVIYGVFALNIMA
ncbi:MAG: oligosaccharide flippase family protein [Chitinophagales bacterium]